MKWWQVGKRNADLERELQSDLQLEEEEQRDHGNAPEEAHYAALRAFGNPSVIGEQTREVWSWDRLETLLRDLKIIIRTLARQPGFSAVAVLVIAIGMGATISLFTVVWSVLLKPLPFDHPDQLVRLNESSDRFPNNVVAPGIYREWKRESRSFSNLALYKEWPQYNLSEGGALPEQVRAMICSWDLFATLGVQPSIGRSFTPEDDQPSANGTVILSWSLWKRRFGGDSSVLGRKINLDAKPYTVIGVMPDCPEVPKACLASPKSINLAPALVSITLPGLRSRWTMALRCAVSKASAIWIPMRRVSSGASGLRASRVARVSPSRNSMTRKSRPSWRPTS